LENGKFNFSIIIPTYNRSGRLSSCLEAISRLDYPADLFEVIIVDDGGETPLDGLLAPFSGRVRVTLVRQAHAGVAIGRNTGAERAKGDFLVFTDDDCQPAPDWLKRLESSCKEENDCIIGGRTVNVLQENLFSTASQTLVSYLFSYYNVTPRQARFLTGSNLTMPSRHFHALDGFDTSFYLMGAEDREFCDRWQYSGFRMVYAPEVIVYHSHYLTLRSYVRQHFNYGRGAFHFQRLYYERIRKRVKVEPLSFYLGMVRYPFLQGHFLKAFLISILLCISQAANLTGFFSERSKRKNRVDTGKNELTS